MTVAAAEESGPEISGCGNETIKNRKRESGALSHRSVYERGERSKLGVSNKYSAVFAKQLHALLPVFVCESHTTHERAESAQPPPTHLHPPPRGGT